MRFNGYTLCQIYTQKSFTKKPGFPLSTLIILWVSNLKSTRIRVVSQQFSAPWFVV